MVAHVYKARYYPNSHFLHASVSPGSSYVELGIMTARENIFKRYSWVLGDGMDIKSVNEPWLKGNDGSCVTHGIGYGTIMSPFQVFLDQILRAGRLIRSKYFSHNHMLVWY